MVKLKVIVKGCFYFNTIRVGNSLFIKSRILALIIRSTYKITNLWATIMDLGSKVIKGLKVGALLRVIAQVFTWVNTLILIRILTPDDYGLMAMVMAFIGIFGLIGDFGVHKALIQAKEVDHFFYRRAFTINLISCCTFFLLFYFLAPVIAIFFDEPAITTPIRVVAFQHIILIFHTLPYAQASRLMKFKEREQVQFYSTIVASIITIVMAVMGFGVWALITGHLLLKLSLTIGYNVISPYWAFPTKKFATCYKLLIFSGFSTKNDMLRYLMNVFPNIWIGKIYNKLDLGFFSVARNLANLPGDKIGELLNHLGLASFSKIQKEPEVAGKYLLKSIGLASMLLFPTYFGMCAVANEAIVVILSEKWIPAIIPFQILCLSSPFKILSELLAVGTTAMGKPQKNSFCLLYSLMLLSLFVFASYHGLIWACLAWLAITIISFIIHLYIIAPVFHLKMGTILLALFPSILGSSCMLLALRVLKDNYFDSLTNFIALPLLIITGAAIFFSIMYILFRNKLKIIINYLRH